MIFFFLWISFQGSPCLAQANIELGSKEPSSKINQSEEEDFSGTPFTEYGEFNESEDEEDDAKFFRFGRFFGVSLGGGFEFVDGNRGALWQGGIPVIDCKLHYWFNFNVALDMGFRTAQHYFDTTAQGLWHVDVNLFWIGIDVKYYFNTQNLSSSISFANPYLLLGTGSFSKTQISNAQQTTDTDNSIGVSAGTGLEFTIQPKKLYFVIEAKMHRVIFKDTFTSIFQSFGLQDLSGHFYTITTSALFTW